MSNLDKLRKEIDSIDREILELIEKRVAVSREIGCAKRATGKMIYDGGREAEKLAEVTALAGPESKPYVEKLFETIMSIAKTHQAKPAYGVLGRSLPHTYSPDIHRILSSNYTYSVIEREPEELDELYAGKIYDGFNVTIPYKKDACSRCDVLDSAATACGSVNTVVFGKDGKTYGYNTDCYGFIYMLHRANIDVKGKNVLVMGTGGASTAVIYALGLLGARSVINAGRRSDVNYENVYDKASDAQIIVNCTPVGMYPNVDLRVVELGRFRALEACCDLIYNPSRTRFIQDAMELGLKTTSGLAMLVAQAYKAARIFEGKADNSDEIDSDASESIERTISILQQNMCNITLIGMPGSGKSILARNIAAVTGRKLVDLDLEYIERYGESPSETFSSSGEEIFRQRESSVAADILPQSGLIISCGGGVVTRDANKFFVRCNSTVVYLDRPLTALTDKNRPISIANGVAKLYEQRHEKYENWCDLKVYFDLYDEKQSFVDEATKEILNKIYESRQ